MFNISCIEVRIEAQRLADQPLGHFRFVATILAGILKSQFSVFSLSLGQSLPSRVLSEGRLKPRVGQLYYFLNNLITSGIINAVFALYFTYSFPNRISNSFSSIFFIYKINNIPITIIMTIEVIDPIIIDKPM
jgi:hypothetical protein